MKIIYITQCYPYSYSGEAFLGKEISRMINIGNDVLIVPVMKRGGVKGKEAKSLLPYVIRENIFSIKQIVKSIKEGIKNYKKIMRIIKIIIGGEGLYNKIMNINAFINSLWLASYAREKEIKHIHSHWASMTSSIAYFTHIMTDIKWSFTAHRGDIVRNNILKEKIDSASFIRFISISSYELAKEICKRKEIKNSIVIHMGVDIIKNRINMRRENIIICPATLTDIKGHKYLIDAAKILKERGIRYKIFIIGKGKLEKKLKKQIEKLSIQKEVKMIGHIVYDKYMKILKNKGAKIVILTSINMGGGRHEGIPVSLMEAMSMEIPVIGTDTGGIKELLDENSGVIIEEKNSLSIANSIEKLINDKELYNNIARNGRIKVERDFNINKIVKEIDMMIKNNN